MAQSESATTRPPRKRATPAAVKPEPTTPTSPEPPTPPVVKAVEAQASTTEQIEKIPVVLELAGRTKRYDRWEVVPGQDVTGALYVPIGSTEVRALLIVPKVS